MNVGFDNSMGPSSSGTVLTAVAHLTSAQILNMNATPVVIIPAPGPGLRVFVLGASAVYNFGTVAYAGGTQLALYYSAAIGALNAAPFLSIALLGNTVSEVSQFARGATGGTGQAATATTNQPIVMTTNAAPTTGDGTVDVYVQYVILPSP